MKMIADLTSREALHFLALLVNLKDLKSVYVTTDIKRNEDLVSIELDAEGLCDNLLSTAFADGGALSSWREKFKEI